MEVVEGNDNKLPEIKYELDETGENEDSDSTNINSVSDFGGAEEGVRTINETELIELRYELGKIIEIREDGNKINEESLNKTEPEDDYPFEIRFSLDIAKKHVYTYLKELQQSGIQSDVVLQCQNGSLLAHKSILAVYSVFLKNAFLLDSENCLVMLPEVPTCHVTTVLELLYSGEAYVKAADKEFVFKILNSLGVQQNFEVIHPSREKPTIKRTKRKLKIKHERNLGAIKSTIDKPPEKAKKRVVDPSELTCSFTGCGKMFPTLFRLKLHTATHSKTCQFMCSSCGRGFKNKYKMHQHEKKNHAGLKLKKVTKLVKMAKRLPRPCQSCSEVFDTVVKLKKHVKECHKPLAGIPCPHCQVLLKSRKTLAIHLKLEHNDNVSQLRFGCTVCTRRFEKRSHLEDHMLRHSAVGQFACMFCPKRCATKQDLDRHLSSHRGEANFKCQVCSMDFVYRKTYTRHVRKHLGQRPYICKPCDKNFTLLETLKKHQASHQKKGDNTRLVTAGKGLRGAISYIETVQFPEIPPASGVDKQKAEVYIPGPNYIYSESITPLNQMQVITDYTEISSITYGQNGDHYGESGHQSGGQYNSEIQQNGAQCASEIQQNGAQCANEIQQMMPSAERHNTARLTILWNRHHTDNSANQAVV